jgi:peptidoglycan/xylan/chitin deacetylase (PgdA/CDA1 family)
VDERIERHLSYFAECAQVVLPGELLPPSSLTVCLTFDDATEDFATVVFPLLQKYQLRALLAVPVQLIETPGYCSWRELKEIAASGRVEIASHSCHHHNLVTMTDPFEEIYSSRRILQERLSVPIKTFVYPFGTFNQTIHCLVRKEYEFVMRIGTAWNKNWHNHSGVIYRIVADCAMNPHDLFTARKKLSYTWFYLLNSIRGR